MSNNEYDHEFENGDVFKTPIGPIQVVSVSADGDYLTVTDPTVDNPQHARADHWEIGRSLLEADLDAGDVERASLEVA